MQRRNPPKQQRQRSLEGKDLREVRANRRTLSLIRNRITAMYDRTEITAAY